MKTNFDIKTVFTPSLACIVRLKATRKQLIVIAIQ